MPDNRHVVLAVAKTIKIYDIYRSTCIQTLDTPSEVLIACIHANCKVCGIVMSPCGKYMISASQVGFRDRTSILSVWENVTSTCRCIATTEIPFIASELNFSSNGRYLLANGMYEYDVFGYRVGALLKTPSMFRTDINQSTLHVYLVN